MFVALALTAQKSKSYGETIVVHTNASTLLTGETLYCQLYCIDADGKTPSSISKIVYAEIIDSDRKSAAKQKWQLDHGVAYGEFFIPTTFKTGRYKLIAYTRSMLSGPDSRFFEMDLDVINPFQPLEAKNIGTEIPFSILSKESNNESIDTGKKNFGTREKVNLKIKNLGRGNYSVSVRKADGFPSTPPSNLETKSKTVIQNGLPELRGEMIAGNIASKNGKDVGGKVVALSIPGQSYAFKLTKTDRNGKFTFLLDPQPSAAEAIVQVMETNRDDYAISLDESQSPDLSVLQFDDLKLSPQFKTAIEQQSVANQIENAYYESKKDSIAPSAASEPFFHPLEKRYVLDDYTRFPTLRETITEVVLEMYTSRSGGKQSIHLRNNTMDPEIYGQPLILVDGLLIQDTNELYDYNPENIYAIDVINVPYAYGPKTFSGVANIVTKHFDYETKTSGSFFKKVMLARPALHKRHFTPDYASAQNSRIPDYRYQLLWQPDVVADGESVIEFYTSDVTGKFEIVVQGYGENGQPIVVRDFIEVK